MQANLQNPLAKKTLDSDTIEYNQLPGPASVPLLGNLLQFTPAKLHRFLEKWGDQYGSIFIIKLGTMPVVVITDPEAIQYVLKNRPEKFRRVAKMDEIISEMGFSGVFNAEGDDWKHQRKLVSQALNMNHLTTFFPMLVSITEKLFNRWNKLSKENASIEIKLELMRYTVDITSRLAFGYNMNTIEKNNDIIQDHLGNIFPAIFKRLNMPVPYWRFFKLPADRRVEKSLHIIVQTMQSVIDETREQLKQNPALKNHPANFLQALIADSDHDNPVSNQMVIGNVLTMLLAGEDTTAHTLTWIFYFMHLHPEVQHKMQQEADMIVGDNNAIKDFEQTTHLPYIEAVAYEAMRLKPVAPMLFFDTLEDVLINQVKIPKNTGVLLQTHYSAIKETHFSNPDNFIPERWIAGGCPYHKAHNEKAFVPFGAGPRFCPGYNLAMIEIKSVLAMVCKNFVVTLETNPDEVREVLAFTMMPTGFSIKLVARK
jgi:cytochrome P450